MKINFYRDLLQQANLENSLATLEALPTWKRPEALYQQTKTMVEEGRTKLVGCLLGQKPTGQNECCGSPSLGDEEQRSQAEAFDFNQMQKEIWEAFVRRTHLIARGEQQIFIDFEKEFRENVRVICGDYIRNS